MSSIFTLLGQKTKAFVDSSVSSLENGAVATNASNISTNSASITTNASSISTNTSNISSNSSSITTNASNISTNASNITTNSSSITTNQGNITTNASDISTANANISTNASDISTNSSDISTNAANITTNSSNISSNDNDISDLETATGSLAADGASASFSGNLGAANLTLTGDLTVQGTTTTVESTAVTVADAGLGLNKGAVDASNNASDVGFHVERGSSENNVAFVWDEGTDRFTAYEASSGNSFTAASNDITVTDSSATLATAQFSDVYVNNGGTATNLGTVAEFDAELT